MKNNDNFNIIITGVGGQGLLTLLNIIATACLNKGLDVKTSELHGLSQRGGSVSAHIRFGKKIYSPMVGKSKANLILALETQEALSASQFSSEETFFLVNKYNTPTLGASISEKQVKDYLEKITKNVFIIPATSLCEQELNSRVVAGVFLLACASVRDLIPLTINDLSKAIEQIMPEKISTLNLRAIELAKTYNGK